MANTTALIKMVFLMKFLQSYSPIQHDMYVVGWRAGVYYTRCPAVKG
jgi:hypothetical protein